MSQKTILKLPTYYFVHTIHLYFIPLYILLYFVPPRVFYTHYTFVGLVYFVRFILVFLHFWERRCGHCATRRKVSLTSASLLRASFPTRTCSQIRIDCGYWKFIGDKKSTRNQNNFQQQLTVNSR